MNAFVSRPEALEEEANRRRARLAATAARLRDNLQPTKLVDEFSRGSGLQDMTPAKAFDFAARRHPFLLVAAGLGAGLLAAFALRAGKSNRDEPREDASVRGHLNAIAGSAADVLRQRLNAKRDALLDRAKVQVAEGASQLSDVIEKGVDDLMSEIPAPELVRPVVESAIQMLMLAALDMMVSKRKS
jgi:hypothetical protein